MFSKFSNTCAAVLLVAAAPFVHAAMQDVNSPNKFWGLKELFAYSSEIANAKVIIPTFDDKKSVSGEQNTFNFYTISGINDHGLLKACDGGYVADIGFAPQDNQIHCFIGTNPEQLTINVRIPEYLHFDKRVVLTNMAFGAEYGRNRTSTLIEAKNSNERVIAIRKPANIIEPSIEETMTKTDFVIHLNRAIDGISQVLQTSLNEEKAVRDLQESNLRTWNI